MTGQYEFYLDYMQAQSGYRATWEPGRNMVPGTIGRLDKEGRFVKLKKLRDLHIIPEIETDNSNSTREMDRTSSDKVNISVKLSGSAPLPGSMLSLKDTGFNISFKGERGIVFKISGYSTDEIVNLGTVEEKVISLYKNDKWDKSWLIVTQVIRAKSATIIISSGESASLELKAKAKVGSGAVKLTDAALGLKVTNQSGETTRILAEQNITPLYQVMGLEHPWFSSHKLHNKAIADFNAPLNFEVQPYRAGELEGDETGD